MPTDTTATVSGIVPNASTGEFVHQQHKRANKSASGRNAPAHYARNANTAYYAFHARADGIPYSAKKYNRRTKEHDTVTVQAGPRCSPLLQALSRDTAGDLVGVPDIRAGGTPTPTVLAGKCPGVAL